jgi:hypothetical protein
MLYMRILSLIIRHILHGVLNQIHCFRWWIVYHVVSFFFVASSSQTLIFYCLSLSSVFHVSRFHISRISWKFGLQYLFSHFDVVNASSTQCCSLKPFLAFGFLSVLRLRTHQKQVKSQPRRVVMWWETELFIQQNKLLCDSSILFIS